MSRGTFSTAAWDAASVFRSSANTVGSAYSSAMRSANRTYAQSQFNAEKAHTMAVFAAERDESLANAALAAQIAKSNADATKTDAAAATAKIDTLMSALGNLGQGYTFTNWLSDAQTTSTTLAADNTAAVIARNGRITQGNQQIAAAKVVNAATKLAKDTAAKNQLEYANGLAGVNVNIAAYSAAITFATGIKGLQSTYGSSINGASDTYIKAVINAADKFDNEYCRLTGRYYDAIKQINLGYGVSSSFFANGSTSTDVQVCFAAGYEIELVDGTTKCIEDFDGTEEIWARHHDDPTGELRKCRVVRAFKNGIKETMLVKFDNGLELRGTSEHPFYVESKGWTPLGELTVGDVCFDREQQPVTVSKILRDGKQVEVYNIEVEGCHTYYIGKDGLGVLVHNYCDDPYCGHYFCNMQRTAKGYFINTPYNDCCRSEFYRLSSCFGCQGSWYCCRASDPNRQSDCFGHL